MKCHQILTGAANRGDGTFGVGSVEGVSFTVGSIFDMTFDISLFNLFL